MATVRVTPIPTPALEYLAECGLDPFQISKDGWDPEGYYHLPFPPGPWGKERRRWPEGFDYDLFTSLVWDKGYGEPDLLDLPDGPGGDTARFKGRVLDALADIETTLIEKNAAYGNSALDPVRVFSKASPEEQLLVRIDDKISRIQRGHEYADEDTVKDLIGYLVLLTIARKS